MRHKQTLVLLASLTALGLAAPGYAQNFVYQGPNNANTFGDGSATDPSPIEARAINDGGQIVGRNYFSDGTLNAASWSVDSASNVSAPQELGLLAGPFDDSGDARAVNSAGVAVGYVTDHQRLGPTGDQSGERPVAWSGNSPIDLGTLSGYSYGEATGINDNNVAVGASFNLNAAGSTLLEATSWSEGTSGSVSLTDLGHLAGDAYSGANGINTAGIIVGGSGNSDVSLGYDQGQVHAVAWAGGSIINLGSLPGYSYANADAINNSNQIVGYSYNYTLGPDKISTDGSFQSQATLWTLGANGSVTVSALGQLSGFASSFARGINDSGEVVGSAYTSAFGDSHAVVWNGGVSQDLNTAETLASGYEGQIAWGINSSGVIVGTGGPTPGTSQSAPVLPTGGTSVGGVPTYTFTGVPTHDWVDPAATQGFILSMTGKSLFTSISGFPTGFTTPFDVVAGGKDYGLFTSSDILTFDGAGVSSFLIQGIMPTVDGSDPQAFPLQLDFNTATADFTMTALAAPEPSQSVALGLGVLGLSGLCLRARRKCATP